MGSKDGSPPLERQDFGDVTVVRFKVPRLDDDAITRDLFGQIDTLVRDAGRSNLVLNLSTPEYLPSLAIGKLVLLNRRTQEKKGRLALCHLSPLVDEVLNLTHLTELFSIYSTEQEPVRSFA